MNEKLYFIPYKGPKVFLSPSFVDTCFMDTAIVDMAGLVRYVEGVTGVHCDDVVFNVRLCQYYRLLREWLEAHPDNVLKSSFDLARLSTARQLLVWRDDLKMAQWDFEFDDVTSRLGVLAGIEKIMPVRGLPDRIINVIETIYNCKSDYFDTITLILPMRREVMPPLLHRLIDALESRGAKIELLKYALDKHNNLSAIRNLLLSARNEKITLNVDDDSFTVLGFETGYEQDEYMSLCQSEFGADLFINPRSKETDNRLLALNRPTSGSVITSRSRMLNLLPLALSLYDEYLQIHKLVEWFTAPLHPLPGRFRFQLAECMARSGGFLNEDCRNLVNRYIEGEYAYSDEKNAAFPEKEKHRKEREEKVKLYIPYFYADDQNEANAEQTLVALAQWARQRIHSLENGDGREAMVLQLETLADSIDILLLLFSEHNECFDLSLANEWVRDIPTDITLLQHPARVGCAFSVANPWDMVSVASHIVWTSMESGDVFDFECSFLLPGERNEMIGHASFWNRSDESQFRYFCSILPFMMADKLTITYAKKRSGELIVAHPLVTRLKTQISNFENFVERRTIDDKRTVVLESVDNTSEKLEYRFLNSAKITLPKRMSATALETFVLYPFDYLFDRILNFQPAGLSGLPELHTTRGNVAHAAIARLFSPGKNAESCDASIIRKRVDSHYELVFQEAINECGAIFMLPENKLERSNFQYQLRNCIDNLLDIIEANELTVDACENRYSKFIALNGCGINEGAEPDLYGYLDMKLTDVAGNPVVFDFKWTRSRKYHRRLLENNRSIQLAVYSELLKEDDRTVKTAYFLMPRGRLVTCHPFKGRYVDVVEKANNNHIMEQLINSFRYRCNQISAGILEEGELCPVAELQYESERKERNLFALSDDEESEVKKENIFSNYRLFKGF